MANVFSRLNVFLRVIRAKDSFVILGGPLLGVLFALNSINYGVFLKVVLFMIAVLFGVGHIFTLNDWLGYTFDKYNPKKINSPLVSGQVSLTQVRKLSLILGFMGLSLLFIISFKVFIIAVLIILNVVCLEHPRILLKGVPLVDTVVNAFGGAFVFLLGYSLFSSFDMRGILIALYFAFLVSGGYLNHAIVDYETDMRFNINTFAVRFGKEKALIASFATFTLSNIYFCLLGFLRIIPRHFCMIVIIIYLFYLYLFFSLHKKGLRFNNLHNFINKYRKLYAFTGMYMAVYLVLSLKR